MAIGYLDSQYLTDIADSIRTKKGTSNSMTVSQMPQEITSIPAAEAKPGFITFYDWDGTILYTYSKEQIQNLTELPALPSAYRDYTANSWTETLVTLKKCKSPWNVGVNYSTQRTSTKVYITLDASRLSVVSQMTVSNWGDGATGGTSHTYSQPGDYVVELPQASIDYRGRYRAILCASVDAQNKYVSGFYPNPIIKEVDLGTGSTLYQNLIGGCGDVKVLIPMGCSAHKESSTSYCMDTPFGMSRVSFLSWPSDFTTNDLNTFIRRNYYLEKAVIPSSLWNNGVSGVEYLNLYNSKFPPEIGTSLVLTSSNSEAFRPSRNCRIWQFPDGITEIGNATYDTYFIEELITPSTITSLSNNIFNASYIQGVIEIGENVTSMGQICEWVPILRMKPTTPPTLTNSNGKVSNYSPWKIYVPAQSLSAYQTAWSLYADVLETDPTT